MATDQTSELTIRRARESDLADMARIHHTAYPGFPMTFEQRMDHFRSSPFLRLEDNWVCLRSDRIVGQFALYNFKMYRNGALIPVGGVARVAVPPEARRDHIARLMMVRAAQVMEQNATPLSLLYPFRHKFYRSIGWGIVGSVRRYRFDPATLPDYQQTRRTVSPVVTYDEQEEVMDCYRHWAEKRHGGLERNEQVWFESSFKNSLCYAYRTLAGKTEGYVLFEYEPLPAEKNLIASDIVVREMVWTSPDSFKGLIAFLRSQKDQIRQITYYDHSHLPFDQILTEPISVDGDRNTYLGAENSVNGSNLMGRVVQLRRALTIAGGLAGVQGRVTLKLSDPLIEANNSPLVVEYDGKRVDFPKTGDSPVTLSMPMEIFSAIYFGSLRLQEAVWLGLAEVDGKGEINWLDRVWSISPPVCLDHF